MGSGGGLTSEIIVEESSKENSSDSSGNTTFKDKLVKEIGTHTLGSILRAKMRPELYQIFLNKYGVQTFEQNQVRLTDSAYSN